MQTSYAKNHLVRASCLSFLTLVLIAPCAYSDDEMSPTAQSPEQTETVTNPQSTEEPQSSQTLQGGEAEQAELKETPPAEEAPQPPKEVATNPHVARALLTTAIADKEPVDEITSINKDSERIYFFTEFTGLKGQAIIHRWEYQGKVMAEVNFNVGSPQWRCYSSKNLRPEWTGMWTVSVIDDKNQVLAEKHFEVTD